MITIRRLAYYPIKSCGACPVDELHLSKTGAAFDRQWMIVNDERVFLSQRTIPSMALIQPQVLDGSLSLSKGSSSIQVPIDRTSPVIDVRIWKDECTAIDQGDAAAEWLSDALGMNCRLVLCPDDPTRFTRTEAAPLAFPDGFPLLIASLDSLAALNKTLTTPIDISRFRANVVVEGAEAWAEDTWQTLTAPNGTVLNLVTPCRRCAVITTEQTTGQRDDPEPLTVLTRTRTGDLLSTFGYNAIHGPVNGLLSVGDVLQTKKKPTL